MEQTVSGRHYCTATGVIRGAEPMAVVRSGPFLKDLRTLYAEGSIGSLTDGQLMERFVACRDQAVFEALVERHGPMVLQICRSVLGNSSDAEDAFQATF